MIVIDIILDIKERETDVPDGEMNILGSNNCHSTSTNSLEGSSGHPRCDENHIHYPKGRKKEIMISLKFIRNNGRQT